MDLKNILRSNPEISKPDFQVKAKPILDEYNKKYLEAEIETTQIMRDNVKVFKPVFQSNEIRRKTQEDEKVRPAHAALNNVVYPASDIFWKSNTPPYIGGVLQYRCRCYIQSADSHDSAQNRITINDSYIKTGIFFQSNHPYFNVPDNVSKELEKLVDKINV